MQDMRGVSASLTLSQVPRGQTAVISKIQSSEAADDSLEKHCRALGLCPGTTVIVLRQSYGKGPMQVKSLGSYYAIRAGEAACIYVDIPKVTSGGH